MKQESLAFRQERFKYGITSFIVRLVIRGAPFVIKSKDLIVGYEMFRAHVNLKMFFAIQFWYVMLFFVYVTFREFIYKVGVGKTRKIFFGR